MKVEHQEAAKIVYDSMENISKNGLERVVGESNESSRRVETFADLSHVNSIPRPLRSLLPEYLSGGHIKAFARQTDGGTLFGFSMEPAPMVQQRIVNINNNPDGFSWIEGSDNLTEAVLTFNGDEILEIAKWVGSVITTNRK